MGCDMDLSGKRPTCCGATQLTVRPPTSTRLPVRAAGGVQRRMDGLARRDPAARTLHGGCARQVAGRWCVVPVQAEKPRAYRTQMDTQGC
jgi:hypothetical protein